MKRNYLNGFRGLAIILVVFGHYSIFFNKGAELFSPVGKIGVILFFILSSYLLTRNFIITNNFTVNHLFMYGIKRVLRIYPMLIITIVLLVLIPTFQKNMFGSEGWSIVNNLFLIYPRGNLWAISVEFQYYLLIPIITFLYLKFKEKDNIIIIILLIIGIISYYIKIKYNFSHDYPHLPPHLLPFIFGSIIAIIEEKNINIFRNKILYSILLIVGILGLINAVPYVGKYVIINMMGNEYLYHKYFASILGISINGSLLLMCIIYNKGTIKRIFSNKILTYLGITSFSIYCLHTLSISFQGAIFENYGPIIGVLYLVAITMIISSISYQLVEKKIQNNAGLIANKIKDNILLVYSIIQKNKLLLFKLFLIIFGIIIYLLVYFNSNNYIVNITISSQNKIGCTELFIDNNWSNPLRVCNGEKALNNLTFKNIEKSNFSFRLDPGSEAGGIFNIEEITLVDEKNNQILEKLNINEIEQLRKEGLKNLGNGNYLIENNDPQIYGNFYKNNLDSHFKIILYKPFIIIIILSLIIILFTIITNKSLLLSIIGLICTIAFSYPGSFNFDELFTLSLYLDNKLNDLHPINQTLMWVLTQDLFNSSYLPKHFAISALLIIQNFIFWGCVYYISTKIHNSTIRNLFLISLFTLPTFLVYNGHIGKDSQLAISLLFAITLIIKSSDNKSIIYLILALFPMLYAWGLRSNGPIALIPIIYYWSYLFLNYIKIFKSSLKTIVLTTTIIIVFFVANNYIFQSRIVDKCCNGVQLQMTPIHDLMGISVRINQNIIPNDYYIDKNYSIDDIYKNYNYLNITWDGLILPNIKILPYTVKIWINALINYPYEYIEHRYFILKYFFGFSMKPTGYEYMYGPFLDYKQFEYSVQIKRMVDYIEKFSENRLNFQQYFKNYLAKTNNLIVYKPWFYLFILIIILISLRKFKLDIRDKFLIFVISGVIYIVPYIILANSAHFRYVWWFAMSIYIYSFIEIDRIFSIYKTKIKKNEK